MFFRSVPHCSYDEWQATYKEWQEENPEKAKMLQDGVDGAIPSVDELMAAIPEFDQDTDIATRIAGQMVLQVCHALFSDFRFRCFIVRQQQDFGTIVTDVSVCIQSVSSTRQRPLFLTKV